VSEEWVRKLTVTIPHSEWAIYAGIAGMTGLVTKAHETPWGGFYVDEMQVLVPKDVEARAGQRWSRGLMQELVPIEKWPDVQEFARRFGELEKTQEAGRAVAATPEELLRIARGVAETTQPGGRQLTRTEREIQELRQERCRTCGRPFKPDPPWSIWCSDECKRRFIAGGR